MEAIPYFPSLEFCRLWMAARLEGFGDFEALKIAKKRIGLKPRDMARGYVAGANGQTRLLLSVAIEGGASAIKRLPAERLRLSCHGEWPKLHLRAMETAYSSTPYYRHYIPGIKDVLESVTPGMSFAEMTSELHKVMKDALDAEMLIPRIMECRQKIEKFDKIDAGDTEMTVFDVIFRKGPEAIFALL